MADGYSAQAVCELLSAHRLGPYLDRSEGAPDKALQLYEWNARISAAAFETVAHLEVLLRNAIDGALARHYNEAKHGIPWFLCRPPMDAEAAESVLRVRDRLAPLGRDTRNQIVAGLSWNRLAHHDSMLGVDVPFELRRVLQAASFIDPEAASWLQSVDRSFAVYGTCPYSPIDTVVVPARAAWPFYQQHCAYICQPGRWFQPVDRIAFYADREIKADVPGIVYRRDNVPWTSSEAAALAMSSDRMDRKVAAIITASRHSGWANGAYQIFLLTQRGDSRHRVLNFALSHQAGRPGSAFVQRQRYVSLHALETAITTADLNDPARSDV